MDQRAACRQALERSDPLGFKDPTPIERLAYVFGFLDGWKAGIEEQQRELDRLRSTLAEYEANRAEFEAWLAGVRSY